MGESLTDTAAQQRVYQSVRGAHKVVAGPGSGKTYTLTQRVVHLVRQQGVHPEEILILTFSRKAAEEIRQRVYRKLQQETPVYTYHAFAARVAHEYGQAEARVLSGAEIWLRLRAIARRHPLPGFTETQIPAVVNHARHFITRSQQELLLPEDWRALLESWTPANDTRQEEWLRLASLTDLYQHYQERKQREGTIDFGDQILAAVRLLWTQPEVRRQLAERYPYLMVDEYQDTNLAQGVMVVLLAGAGNVVAVGDEDQAIYGFQGATPANLSAFDALLARLRLGPVEPHLLGSNFRSVPGIVQVCISFLGTPKPLEATRVPLPGEPHLVLFEAPDAEGQAEFVAREILDLRDARGLEWGDFAILCGRRAGFQAYEDAFRRYGIPMWSQGAGGLMDRPESRDLHAYLRWLADPQDRFALLRILERPPLLLSPDAIQTLLREDHRHLPLQPEAQDRFQRLCDFGQRVRAQLPFRGLRWAAREALEFSGWFLRVRAGRMEAPDRTQGNLEALLALAGEMEAAGGDLPDFLEYLEAAGAAGEDPGEGGQAIRDAVNVMTIHAAKGLEWRVVFVDNAMAGNLPRTRRRESCYLFRDPLRLAWERLLQPSGGPEDLSPWNDLDRLRLDVLGPERLIEGDPEANRGPDVQDTQTLGAIGAGADSAWLRLLEQPPEDRHQAEERRLAYVAFTRAKERLYVGAYGRRRADSASDSAVLASTSPGYWKDLYFQHVHPSQPLAGQSQSRLVPVRWEGEGVRFISLRAVEEALAHSHPRLAQVEARRRDLQDYAESLERDGVHPPAFVADPERFMERLEGERQRLLQFPAPPLARPYVSVSGLLVYARCPLRYRFECELRLPLPLSAGIDALQVGEEVHAAIEAHSRGGATEPILRRLSPRAHALFQTYLLTPEAGRAGEGAVEARLRLELEEGIVEGRADRLLPTPEGLQILDYKTGRLEADELQLWIYALGLASRQPVRRVAFVYLAEGRRREVEVEENELEARRAEVARLLRRLAGGDREPTPGAVCSLCPYRYLCTSADPAALAESTKQAVASAI